MFEIGVLEFYHLHEIVKQAFSFANTRWAKFGLFSIK